MDSVEKHITWSCTDWKCTFKTQGDMNEPYDQDKRVCPVHRIPLVRAEFSAEPQPAAPVETAGDMTAFLATDRAMELLSAMRRVMDAPQAQELWVDKKFRSIIAAEWRVLKSLMGRAGFDD